LVISKLDVVVDTQLIVDASLVPIHLVVGQAVHGGPDVHLFLVRSSRPGRRR
jgi:hypothetical protein